MNSIFVLILLLQVHCFATEQFKEYAVRYDAIADFLRRYERAITVLDVGADQGYYSFRIASEFDATCVMIEVPDINNDGERTLDRLELQCTLASDLKNLILLKKQASVEELKILSQSEHFDVVLALNVVQRFGTRWKAAVDAILNMGDHIIFEAPVCEREIFAYLQKKKGTLLGEFSENTMFLFSPMKGYLQRIHWTNGLSEARWNDYQIQSSFTSKNLYKHTDTEEAITPWVKGINLETFKMLSGAYPTSRDIHKMLLDLGNLQHNDFKIWNVIIQGKSLVPIDGASPRYAGRESSFSHDFKKVLDAFPP